MFEYSMSERKCSSSTKIYIGIYFLLFLYVNYIPSVSLLTYCSTIFLANLCFNISGLDKQRALLDWDARIKIALGAARGFAYPHEDSSTHVIHPDFKARNIFLEDDFTPKVSDFGLGKSASE